MLCHRITAGEHEGTAWILDGATLRSSRAAFGAATQLNRGCRTGRKLSFFSCTLATTTTAFAGLSSRCFCRLCVLGNVRTVAILAGVSGFAATGQSLTAGENKISAGVALWLDLRASCRCNRSRQAGRAPGRHCDGSGLYSHRSLVGIGIGAGCSGVRGSTHPISTGSSGNRGFLTGSCQRLSAFKCEFATGESCHVRPRMST